MHAGPELRPQASGPGQRIGSAGRAGHGCRDGAYVWSCSVARQPRGFGEDTYLRTRHPDHTDVYQARSRLAHAHGRAGQHAEAAALLERLLADVLRLNGPDHPAVPHLRAEAERARAEADNTR
ncbi:tetratricopeptide repeat protein [Kitasatospora sp. NPDC048407]|uniref:tetratricopeptide repeat protein n=1 Tax=Kitasatospora sp. NPDC048407 TaxID=3364051 RepID=UPI003718A914